MRKMVELFGSDRMSELRVESSLSMEEIENNFKDVDFFSSIMDGLKEALAYTKGKAADTFVRKRILPTVNVVEIRTALDMTQKAPAKSVCGNTWSFLPNCRGMGKREKHADAYGEEADVPDPIRSFSCAETLIEYC